MDTSVDGSKKLPVEDLPKEEIIKKYRGLLNILQKAKQSKDSLIEENNILKQKLEENANPNAASAATEELLEKLTQQKLDLFTTLEEVKSHRDVIQNKLKDCELSLRKAEEKIVELDTSNQSYQRQVNRLTEENEQLLTHLDTLEKQTDELKKIGLQQQQQLLELEKNNDSSDDLNEKIKMIEALKTEIDEVRKSNENLMSGNEELSEKNTKVTEENKRLSEKHEELNQNIETLKINYKNAEILVTDMKATIEEKNKQNESYLSTADDLNTELHKNKAMVEKLQQDIMTMSSKLSDNQIVCSGVASDLQNTNEKLRDKLKFYHSKIIKLAGDVKVLKQQKTAVFEDFRNYVQQVKLWEAQLKEFSAKVLLQFKESEDEKLQAKNKIEAYTSQVQILEKENSNLKKCNDELANELKIKIENDQSNKLNLDNNYLKEEINKSRKQIEELHNELEILRAEHNSCIAHSDSLTSELKILKDQQETEKNTLKDEIENLHKTNQTLVENLQQKLEGFKSQELKIQELDNELDILRAVHNTCIAHSDSLTSELKILKDQQEKGKNTLNDEIENLHETNQILVQNLQEKAEEFKSQEVKIQELLANNKNLSEKVVEFENKYQDVNNFQIEISNLQEDNKNLTQNLEQKIEELKSQELHLQNLSAENKSLNEKAKEFENKFQEDLEKIADLNKVINNLQGELDLLKTTEVKLAEQSANEITKLVQESKNLLKTNTALEQRLLEAENAITKTSTSDCGSQINAVDDQLSIIKRENAELLTEMNEMNQVLKERGETISKQQEYCEELLRNIKVYESQASKLTEMVRQKEEIITKLEYDINLLKNQSLTQSTVSFNEMHGTIIKKDEEITQLRNELSILREKLHSSHTLDSSTDANYAESETMSTSTISRTEEMSRIKDLEGSWEERYGKLRSLALKLKGKIRDLTGELTKEQNEKADIQQKLSNSLKTTQTLQSQSDKLQDELEQSKKELKDYSKKLDGAALDISNSKKQLANDDEVIMKLRADIESLNKEKINTDNWKKQVSSKVQNLRKELEANNVLKKEFENQISKLNAQLEAKEKLLKEEIEKHSTTKSSLQESHNECKKQSVLNLEMQDYERSLKDLTQKLDKKQELITKLKNQIDSQKCTISAMKEQNRLLEDRIQSEETDLNGARGEIQAYKKSISDLEAVVIQKDDKIQDLTRALENCRAENEDLSTQLSKIVAQHQKAHSTLKSEKDYLRSQNLGLEQRLREIQDGLKLKEDEVKALQTEYQSYKVRAQSVLRQNQTRDVGLEEKLSEEAASFKAQVAILSSDLNELKTALGKLKDDNAKLKAEKELVETKNQQLVQEIEERRKQHETLSAKHQKTISDHAEAIRGLKVHSETLAQCYRQQLSEQEVRHNREVIELQSKIEKVAPAPEVPPLSPPSIPREQGEGSESVDTKQPINTHPVPLDRLLSSETDQDIGFIRKQLTENEAKVTHLTALLADTEQDLAKHVQMNKLLKEEIRRQQRSVEREKHAENLEYLKNVVFKFATLSSGDERSHLVPVLNTILKFSPEETNKLNMVARGDLGSRGWTNYLPVWSSGKPQ